MMSPLRVLFVALLCLAWKSYVAGRCCSEPPTTPRPSRAPTISPSRIPSAFPTRKPSRSPTPQPSRLPSAVPTRKPTRSPTIYPSESPTEEPTYMPSQPTSQPSSTPTTVTPRPSYRPSIVPTATPSVIPTLVPTREPTIRPTIRPSVVPTVRPSRSPTVAPSPEPTAEPSLQPSRVPTPQPSISPSRTPSLVPTPIPTQEPTEMPTISFKPTPVPSRVPTVKPSPTPTRAPSTVVATTVTLSLSQVLVNIDAESFSNCSANSNAFTEAVSDSIDGIHDDDVSIVSIVDGDATVARYTVTEQRRHLRVTQFRKEIAPRSAQPLAAATMEVPQITIEYLIAFVMEELGYDNGTLAVRFAADSLSEAVGDGTFLESLRAAVLLLGADPALLNITSSSLTLISSSVVVLRSAVPSMQPTFPAGSENAASYGNWPVSLQYIVPILAALVLLAIIAALWLWRSVCCGAVCCAWLVCAHSTNDAAVPTSVPSDAEGQGENNGAAPDGCPTQLVPTSEPVAVIAPQSAQRRFTLLSLFGVAAPAATADSETPSPSASAQMGVDEEQGSSPALHHTAPSECNNTAPVESGDQDTTATIDSAPNSTQQNSEHVEGADETGVPVAAPSNTAAEKTAEPSTASYTVLPPVVPRTPTFLDYISSAYSMVIPDGDDDQSLASERSTRVPSTLASSSPTGAAITESPAATPVETDTVNSAARTLSVEEEQPVPELSSGVADSPAATTPIVVALHNESTAAAPVPTTRAKLTFRLAAKRFSTILTHRNHNTDAPTAAEPEPAASPLDDKSSHGAPSDAETGSGDKAVTSSLKTASKRLSQIFHLPAPAARPASFPDKKNDQEEHFEQANSAASKAHAAASYEATDPDQQPKKTKSTLSSAARRLSAFIHTKHLKPADSSLDTPAAGAPAGTNPDVEAAPQPPSAAPEIVMDDAAVPPPPPPESASETTTSATPNPASTLMAGWLFGAGTVDQADVSTEGVSENRTPFAAEPVSTAPPISASFDDIESGTTSTAPPRSHRSTSATADDNVGNRGVSSPRSAGQRLPSSGAFTRPKSILKTSGSRSPSPLRGSRVVFSDSDKSGADGSENGSAMQDAEETAEGVAVRPVATSPRRASLLDMVSAAMSMIIPDSLDEPDDATIESEKSDTPPEVPTTAPEDKEDESQISHAPTALLQPSKASPQVSSATSGATSAPMSSTPGMYDSPVKARPRASTTAADETIVINLSRNSPPRSGFNPLRFFSPSRHPHPEQDQTPSSQHTEDRVEPALAPLPTVQLGDQDSVPVREPNVNRVRSSFSRRLSAAGAGPATTSPAPTTDSSHILAMEPAPLDVDHAASHAFGVPQTPPRRQSLNAPSPEMRRMYATAPPVVNYAKRGPLQSGSGFSKPKSTL